MTPRAALTLVLSFVLWMLLVAGLTSRRAAAQSSPPPPTLRCMGRLEVRTYPSAISAICVLGPHEIVVHDPMRPERDAHGAIVPDAYVGTWITYAQ